MIDGRPIPTATDRYKLLLANALERVCVLEAELELAQRRLAEIEAAQLDDELERAG